jgi:glycosyltransferase involved in cell wall biosynthesis
MSKELPLVSVVIPAYNEAENIGWFYKELTEVLSAQKSVRYELLYVNDGSRDDTGKILEKLGKKDKHIRYISLARNFGKEAATSAGIHHALGDAVILVDADGQHPPKLIPPMITAWLSGVQHVVGVRTSNKKAGLIKNGGSKVFYWVTSKLGATSVLPNATDFRLIDRELVDTFKRYKEKKRMTRALLDWSGFATEYISFDARDREYGKATYSVRALVRLAVNGYIGATLKPLYFVGAIGGIVTTLCALALVVLGSDKYIFNDPLHLGVTGTALIALFVTFLVGILMICQGIVAIYVANIHLEAQDRPLYIVNRAKSKI